MYPMKFLLKSMRMCFSENTQTTNIFKHYAIKKDSKIPYQIRLGTLDVNIEV
jgi:hypothetical protein